MADASGARRNLRYEMSRPVRVIAPQGETISGTMQNVSRGGMLVAMSVEVELGRTYQIEVTDSEGVFQLLGEALRIHLPPRTSDGGETAAFKVGFEFVGTDAAAGERLGRLLAEVTG